MSQQDVIDGIKEDIAGVHAAIHGEHGEKDGPRVAADTACGSDDCDPLVSLLLVVAGHQETWGHEVVKLAAKQWLEENVSGLGDFYAGCSHCGSDEHDSDDCHAFDGPPPFDGNDDTASNDKYERDVLGITEEAR